MQFFFTLYFLDTLIWERRQNRLPLIPDNLIGISLSELLFQNAPTFIMYKWIMMMMMIDDDVCLSVCLSVTRAFLNTSCLVRLTAIPARVRRGHVTNDRRCAGNESNKVPSGRRSTRDRPRRATRRSGG